MKKLVYSLAVLFSVALVSCGGNKAAEATDTDTIATDTQIEAVEVVDTANDTAVVAAEVTENVVAVDSAAAK
ncbi:MAG: hypothetical protein NC204_02755 [Candidatus Amulumruptor caecigallinarius]|nr:hypothetical protein [Candidatus Amulumruptor caecigallinarius]